MIFVGDWDMIATEYFLIFYFFIFIFSSLPYVMVCILYLPYNLFRITQHYTVLITVVV